MSPLTVLTSTSLNRRSGWLGSPELEPEPELPEPELPEPLPLVVSAFTAAPEELAELAEDAPLDEPLAEPELPEDDGSPLELELEVYISRCTLAMYCRGEYRLLLS